MVTVGLHRKHMFTSSRNFTIKNSTFQVVDPGAQSLKEVLENPIPPGTLFHLSWMLLVSIDWQDIPRE
ncbi:hypothetical protein BDP27DRAFT_914035 [Rhodocollybia butyracea]|uniref:Uncharacterized protein n=1 Tax=Rhodocollybia butyracea TaxID=206335 RepID=A0A9P5PQ55_9AGAR|nr:hypothetical protein BDP27DRAFT_914035 [Rhodocollybia butyracea]